MPCKLTTLNTQDASCRLERSDKQSIAASGVVPYESPETKERVKAAKVFVFAPQGRMNIRNGSKIHQDKRTFYYRQAKFIETSEKQSIIFEIFNLERKAKAIEKFINI